MPKYFLLLPYINFTQSESDFVYSETVLREQRELAKDNGLNFKNIVVSHLFIPCEIQPFLEMMEDETIPKPVYLYCYAGAIRTPHILKEYKNYLETKGEDNKITTSQIYGLSHYDF